MATVEGSSAFVLPKVPTAHKDFVAYINKKDGKQVQELVVPYNAYESKLREIFAQQPDHPSLQDPHVNAVPLFDQGVDVPRISHRDIDEKTHHQDHLMCLSAKKRKPAGSPAMVHSIHEFKKNFNLFSESSLADLDWSNVVAAGSSVVTPLLPVPKKYSASKKAQREWYHQQLAPSSDVDLFVWGLDEAAAQKKIEQIEESVRNAILEEVTTVRTKNCITIASHYPIRHVQIVLRLYKSVSEILSGFDVDCSCFAYDGNQIYGTPRGITAFMTQTNTIDLSRRSPSYESRLSKYARRGFEVYWPELERSRIDPTIFERSFARTMGLARLLVLEQLPKPSDREDYLSQRREERGRPPVNYYHSRRSLPNNVKDRDPDDIPEWVYDDEVSNYHSFTVPYGPKYHAKKIEKLLYTKDILLNAEWNQNKDRTVNLHRHPCFMGPLKSVVQDCCGFCPKPTTDEERETAQEESKIYVSGDLEFMKDDPGRQAIGSFNPLTKDDWTEMAYIGNTQMLCQKICDGDVDFVRAFCEKNPNAVDRRDHTGRTPLHLATQSSTPEVVKSLVENGARIVSRLVDGTTALHIAAAQGNVDMVKILLEKSEANEAEEAEKEDRKKAKKHKKSQPAGKGSDDENTMDESKDEEADDDLNSDNEMNDASSVHDTEMTEGSFVKVNDKKGSDEDALDNSDSDEPDVYDVNVIAWDTAVSPLHLAILGGHTEVIKTLIGVFGADALLPVKIINQYSRNPQDAIMTLVLAARAISNSLQVTRDLLAHGASSAQADIKRVSSFHYLVAKKKIDLLKACIDEDGPAAKNALNHLVVEASYWRPSVDTPLTTAIRVGYADLVSYLLDIGAKPVINLDDFASAYFASREQSSYFRNDDAKKVWREEVTQPVLLAIESDMPEVVLQLLDAGADINTIDKDAQKSIERSKETDKPHLHGSSLLDTVISKIAALEKTINQKLVLPKPPKLQAKEIYLNGIDVGSYSHWYISKSFESAENIVAGWEGTRSKKIGKEEDRPGKQQRLEALKGLRARFVDLKNRLEGRGAKTLEELQPTIPRPTGDENGNSGSSKEVSIEMKVNFRVSASDEVLDGYTQLFEAAWNGNNEKIKELTLATWGLQGERKPLQVTVQDEKGFTPFSIAMFRRHFDTASLVLGIANAQFKEPENSNTRRRYEIAEGSDYDSEDDGSDDDGSEGLNLSSQVIDEEYTYDNVASLQDSVGSNISATDMLKKGCQTWWMVNGPEKEARETVGSAQIDIWGNLVYGRNTSQTSQNLFSSGNSGHQSMGRYALVVRDVRLFRFWLHCCQETSKMKQKADNAWRALGAQEFRFALEHGFVEELAEMIKIAGAELPLNALIQKTGIEDAKKPKYYQGLSIGGQKMTAWARERGNDNHRNVIFESVPPLLQAAHAGNLAAVEWFLSDTPLRLYKEHKDRNKDDARLRKLAEAPGGFHSAVGSWLKQRNELALHIAILSAADQKKSIEVIKYLVEIMPDTIDVPSVRDQLTPLALAFLLGRVEAAEALVKAGADQTTRDSSGKNLVHLALINASKSQSNKTKKFRNLLNLIDKRVIRSLFVERCKDGPGGLTPLGLWLANPRSDRYYDHTKAHANLDPEILSIMLEFGGEEPLTMMDSSGQFPLHLAVKTSYTAMVKSLLASNPSLLFRENAMGQTPLELAHSLYIRNSARYTPNIRRNTYKPLEQREAEEFVEKDDGDAYTTDKGEEDGDWNDEAIRTWMVCKRFAEQESKEGRKLVSVNEAREVARRLADRQQQKKKEERTEAMKEVEDIKEDEVDRWLGSRALELS